MQSSSVAEKPRDDRVGWKRIQWAWIIASSQKAVRLIVTEIGKTVFGLELPRVSKKNFQLKVEIRTEMD